MWLPFTLLLLAGAVVADYEHGWKIGNEYQYLVRSRTLTGFDQLIKHSDLSGRTLDQPPAQYSGVLIKALLTVQCESEDTLLAKLSGAQYAQVHVDLPDGWDSEISDRNMDLRELPVSGNSFEIKLKHGMITNLIVDRSVPTWELNLIKSVVSQLQVDTLGENAKRSRSIQLPEDDEEPYATFKTMEDSVAGKCEVLYDVTPLPEHVRINRPELVPLPELKGEGQIIDIQKVKNYTRCEQRMGYHFGLNEGISWEPGSNQNGKFFSRATSSRIIISGNLKSFTIQSSVTTDKMYISPRLHDEQIGVVLSRMNLTLARTRKSSEPIQPPSNPESSGNLVYSYNDPFSQMESRKSRRPSVSPNSRATDTSSMDATSSSEEMRRGQKRPSINSISSSEEREFWQPKPTLNDPPQSPLLPYFVGYKGKSVGMSDKIDLVKEVRNLVSQIADELENPTLMPVHGTVEKFLILSTVLRTMNTKQIEAAQEDLYVSPNQVKTGENTRQENAWEVFREAITQAGTGPALMTIKKWIEDDKLSNDEASEIMSKLAKTARTPTSEYVDTLFELITTPKVMNQKSVNVTSVLAFTDLVRTSQISNSTIHNRYPVHSFGRMSSKHNQAVFQKYIPFLSRQLDEAIKNGDSSKAQVYTMGLGNIGHPRILAVYEPYLEGKKRTTHFQRLMMVASLSKLAEIHPKIARSVLHKIYLNTQEAHEVRCMAVFLLMKTNPPLAMLQRMAEFTNYDLNMHVNSAVKSAIENAAELQGHMYKDLANKARIARKLLTTDEYSYQFSRTMSTDSEDMNFSYRMMLSYIGSDDSIFPRVWYMAVDKNLGGYNVPTSETGFMVSSIKDLLEALEPPDMKAEDSRGDISFSEKISKLFNIQAEDAIPLEGNLFMNSKYATRFYPFDKHSMQKIPELIGECLKSLREGKRINKHLIASHDIVVSFPTETGLPFTYSLKAPMLTKLTGKAKMNAPDVKVSANVELRLLAAMKLQARLGFVTPFDHQHFISGIDVSGQVYLPGKIEVELTPVKRHIQLKLQPVNDEQQARLLYFSVVPYITRHDILNLEPITHNKNTRVVHVTQPEKMVMAYPSKGVSAFKVEAEADNLYTDSYFKFDSDDTAQRIMFPWDMQDPLYHRFDVYAKPNFEDGESLLFTATYDSMEDTSDSSEDSEWSSKAKAPEITDAKPDSQARRKQFLKEAAKGINSPRSAVLDVRVELPGKFKNRHAVTLAWARSNVDQKSRALFFWHVDFFDREFTYEVCASAQTKVPWTPMWDYEKAINMDRTRELVSEIRYGPTCSGGGQINVKATQSQSKELNEEIHSSLIAKKCKEDMKSGNKATRSCQQATDIAVSLDQIDTSVQLDSDILKYVANRMIHIVKSMIPSARVNLFNPKNLDQNRIDARLKLSSDFQRADLTLYTADMDVTFADIDLSELEIQGPSLLATSDDMETRTMSDGQDESSCVLDKSQITTFDDRTYPAKLGDCWHVLMTTYPKRDPENPKENLRVPQDMRVTVLSQEVENDEKIVKVYLGNKEIRFSPEGGKLQVTVDGNKIKCSQTKSHKEMEEEEVAFEIFELPDGSIRLMSDRYDVDTIYDGQRIQIWASDKYRNSLRGLCGNFDGHPDNDFTTPKNCMLSRPDEFAATYALTQETCNGPAAENAKRAEQAKCTRWTYRYSNVINNVEAGRPPKSSKWGYHKHEKANEKQCNSHKTKVISPSEDKICFTTRPVPVCAPGCSPIEEKPKNYPLHCMPKNEASLEMKKRVEQGANPDLSQKPVSMTQPIQVPVGCAA